MTPTRVLHVVTSLDPGGIETMLMNLYRNVDRRVIQFDFAVHRSQPGSFEPEVASLGGRVFRFSALKSATLPLYSLEFKKFLRQHPEHRIVHSHLNQYSCFPLLGAKLAGAPVRISHSHQDLTHHPRLSIARSLTTKVCKRLLPTVSTRNFACATEAGTWLFGESDFELLPNSIDTERFAFDEQERFVARSKHGLNGRLVLGHVGNFSPVKNYGFLLDLLEALLAQGRPASLLLVGDYEKNPKLLSEIDKRGLSDEVVLTGVVSDVEKKLNAMDAFVFPSLREGLPVAVVEAQANGLPCFVSDAVTEEVKLSDSVTFLSLQAGVDEWRHQITHTSLIRSSTAARDVSTSGYDVAEVSEVLQGMYLNALAG